MAVSRISLPVVAAVLALAGGIAAANPTVGGAAMYETKTIVENAANSKDHTTLVAAVKAAELAETLSAPGPFTVFAPTDAAFAKLPAGTIDTLLEPENKPMLTGILTYHVVPGRLTATDIAAQAKANGGKAVLTTVQGAKLSVWQKDGSWYVSDTKGGSAKIGPADVLQSNGVIHVIDSVLLPAG
ncbi:fasciclin domain-containing protein [Sphingopyxis chilensis]